MITLDENAGMRKIVIRAIPHAKQRYDTVGDWYVNEDGELTITVSSMKDWRYELLVAIHELVEVALCTSTGVTQQNVDDFDLAFKGEGEPGASKDAPYRNEHCAAEGIERMLAVLIGVDWPVYDEAVSKL
jgi:hypothetical protein